MRENGGFLRKEDFEKHTSTWIDQVSTNYRGYDVFELPPNGQGIATLQIRMHKMRSVLTALGVIIGIIAVTLMGSAITGIEIGFDRSLEEAAQDLGANPIVTFWKVTMPLIWPGIIAGALLAFALSIDDFVVSNFTAGTEVTFPLYIFGAAQRGIPVQVYIIATMLFSITLLAMMAARASPPISS